MALPAFTTTKERWRIGKKDGKFLRVITASLAKQTLRRDQRANKFPKGAGSHIRVVDRQLGRPEEAVRHGGVIVYQSNMLNLAEVLAWIAEYLVRLSPVGIKRPIDRILGGYRGQHYQDAHLYMVDGRSVMTVDKKTTIVGFERTFQTAKHTKDSKHVFVNTMPYAKRFESKGVTTIKNGKINNISPWSFMASNGVYKKVARAAKRRFGETVRIDYKVLSLNLPFTQVAAGGGRMKQLYPVIVVRAKSFTKGAIGQ